MIEEVGESVRKAAVDISFLLGHKPRSNSDNGKTRIALTRKVSGNGQYQRN
jgi:hypothetical protein